ncbi:MAG: hypothetical protein WAU65_01395 [Candidatus Nanoarchaeia archaeon]
MNNKEDRRLEKIVRKFARTNPEDIEKSGKNRDIYTIRVGEIRLRLNCDYFERLDKRSYTLNVLCPNGQVKEHFSSSKEQYDPILENMFLEVHKKCSEHLKKEEDATREIKGREDEKMLKKLYRSLSYPIVMFKK